MLPFFIDILFKKTFIEKCLNINKKTAAFATVLFFVAYTLIN